MKKTKEDNTELYVIVFKKKLINEVTNSISREEAINYITGKILPNIKAAFKEIKKSEIH